MAQARAHGILDRLRYDPPNGGKRERLIFANRDEEKALKRRGGSGHKTKLGVRSYMIDGSYGSGFSDHTMSGGATGAAGNNSGAGNGGSDTRNLGLTTGNVTGPKAYGPAGGNAVGMGAPGYGSPAETAATLARQRPKLRTPVRPAIAPPKVPVPIPRVKPPVPMYGPNVGIPDMRPQIGGTTPAGIMDAIMSNPSYTPSVSAGFTPGYGAPGGVNNPVNNGGDFSVNYGNDQNGHTFGDAYSPGPGNTINKTPPTRSIGTTGDMTRADVPGLSGTFDGGRRFGDQRTIGSPAAPTSPTPATMQRNPFSTYVRSPYRNGPVQSEDQVVFKNYNKMLDRLRQNPNYRVGDVFGPDSSRPRSPDPREQRLY